MAKTKNDLDPDRTQNVLTSSLDISTRLLSTDEVARLLVVPVTTLYTWRYKGTGPKAYRVGKHLRYRLVDVLTWLEATRVRDLTDFLRTWWLGPSRVFRTVVK